MTKTWTKAFLVSHICGWILANIQTIWIIWEIRRLSKRIEKGKKGDKYENS